MDGYKINERIVKMTEGQETERKRQTARERERERGSG